MKRILSSLVLALLGGCVVFLHDQGGPPKPVFPTDPCLEDGRPSVHVIIAARIDRGTINLADAYGNWIKAISTALIKIGARPTRVVLLPLDEHHDRTPLLAAAGCGIGGEGLDPAELFRFYASRAGPREAGNACAVTPLVEAGAKLQTLVTDYPADLNLPSGRRVFDGEPPDAVIVMHLDSLARSAGLDEPSCDDAHRLASDDWLGYSRPIGADRVFHWMIVTDEGIGPDAFSEKCRKVEGVSLDTLDILEPSARALFNPLASEIESAGGHAALQSMCEMLGEKGAKAFLIEQLIEVAGALGLDAGLATEEALSPAQPGIEIPPSGASIGGR